MLALRRIDALRDLALATLSFRGALEVARGVGGGGDRRVEFDLERRVFVGGILERHALGARGHAVRIGEQRLAEPPPLGGPGGLGQVAAERLDLAGELLRKALERLTHGLAPLGGGVGRVGGGGSVVIGHGGRKVEQAATICWQ